MTQEFSAQQLLTICRLADDAMSRLVDQSAQHITTARRADPTDDWFVGRDYLSDWYGDYAEYGRLRQAAGSLDDQQHTRERFDTAVAERVTAIDSQVATDRGANLL